MGASPSSATEPSFKIALPAPPPSSPYIPQKASRWVAPGFSLFQVIY